jgi:arylsulfatase A-like enzyme
MGELHSMTRRTIVKNPAAGTLALAAEMGKSRRARAQAMQQPNIIFIMADDLGYADVSCYGRPDIHTPNIDLIAASGTRFLHAYANSAVCSATRTALMTGRYQYRLPIGLEEPLPSARSDVGLPPEHPTLPSLLKKAGYSTMLIGKWHLGKMPAFSPLKSGYEHFYGFQGGAIDYFTHQGTDHKDDFWSDVSPIKEVGYTTELFGQHAVDFIAAMGRAGQPFLLSLHFNAPHWPWEAEDDEAESERLRQKSLADFDGGTQRTYQRMIQGMDVQIGRVLSATQTAGIIENTIVIFTSDNGGERFADTWPFTGRKTELLEGGLRIPSIVSWPARVPKGKTTDQVAISMDWTATLISAGGARPDSNFPMDGIDLLPQLTEGAASVPRKLYWRYKGNSQQAMRDGDFKYLRIRDNTFLFNVVEDPMERANLKERRKDIYDRLISEWDRWNVGMLPVTAKSHTDTFKGSELADHYGVD